MGRPCLFERPLTNAEKQQRKYAKKKNSAKAVPPNLITKTDVQQCFQNAMLRLRGKSRLKMPTDEYCNFTAIIISNGAKILEECGAWDASRKLREFHWASLTVGIHVLACVGWHEVGPYPRAVNHNSPSCIFVAEILAFFGIKKTASAVSEVLRGRRNINATMSSKGSYEKI